ncbi:MAG: response regulator transcription factor [Pseudomonadota bacterium]
MIRPDQTASQPARVLIADDHPVVRAGMGAIIDDEADLHCVAQATGVESAIEAWHSQQPDLGIFDLRMADGDAISAITRIRRADGAAKILVISSYDSEEEVYRVMRSGARGYLLKDDEPEVIVGAVRAVLAGKTYLAPHLAGKLATRIGEDELSQRETQILQLVAAGKTNPAIAKALNISTSTIKFHLNNVYSKLGVSSRTSAVAAGTRRGIISIS